MKKIIVLVVLFFFGVALLSSCETQKKCAAYGHYTYYPAPSETLE